MIKFFSKLTAVISIALFIGASVAMASGKMEVNIGEKVDMTAESKLLSPQFKWVVTQGKDIISTQTGANLSTQFDTQGEYSINLTATSGNAIENTTISVLVGDKYPKPSGLTTGETGTDTEPGVKPLILNLQTLPASGPDNTVTIIGDSGKVQFFLGESYGDILEYRIDKNIYQDSDGNGVANDDIDNSGDNSYLTGSPWVTDYKQGDSPKTVAEVTLVDKNGKKVTKQVEIVFQPQVTTGDLKAVLDVSPAPDPKDNMVHLYNDPHKVSFYARPSEGKILEYRIDKNIFEDSDGDGDPANDIDNINDISFKTGDVFQTEYKKTDKQIIAQLIVVGENGKGSRVQKGLVFGDKPLPPVQEGGETGVRLTADKDSVIKGDPITFTVEGLQLSLDNYKFEWDFNGDGTVDKETDGVNTVQNIYDVPGVMDVKVTITDKQGNSVEKTLEIVSKDTVVTKSDFSFDVQGNTVKFTDSSTAAYNLTDKQLFYNWDFGDTDPASYTKQKDQSVLQNPSYTYNKAGKYLVTLAITDADQVTDSKSAEVDIAQSLPGAETPVANPTGTKTTGSGGSLILSIFKIILYLILIVVVLIIFIVGGFLAFLKVQHPELTFEELIDEFKVKILTMIGAHEDMGTSSVPPTMPSSSPSKKSESPVSSVESEKEEAGTTEEESAPHHPPVEPMEPEVGPMPDWLKGTDVIEGQVEEPSSNDQSPMTNDQSSENNGQSPMTNDQSSENNGQSPMDNDSSASSESSTNDQSSETQAEEQPQEPIEEPSSNDQSPMTNDSSTSSEPSANDQSTGDLTEEELPPDESADNSESISAETPTEDETEEEITPEENTEESEEIPAEEVAPKDSTPVATVSISANQTSAVSPKLGSDGQPVKKKRRRRHKKKRSPLTPGQTQLSAGGDKPQTPPPSAPSEYKDVPMA
jgi:hypothetical protein